MLPRLPAPIWFYLALACAVRGAAHWLGLHELERPDVSLAFFGWLVAIGQAVWAALSATAQVTVTFLAWAVNALWIFARMIYSGLREFGSLLLAGFRKAWDFLELLYSDVLLPAWRKFWKFIDWARDTLERIFRPILDVLVAIRRELLELYDRFVRPVLDAIGIARKVLRVFSTFGLKWARALDAKLAQLEELVDRPFRLLLREINRIIGWINRVVTADGLFQRLALIRSVERDVKYIHAALHNSRSNPPTDAARAAVAAANQPPTFESVSESFDRYLLTKDGDFAEIYRLGADADVFLDVPILRDA